jgi:hypothetical protein
MSVIGAFSEIFYLDDRLDRLGIPSSPSQLPASWDAKHGSASPEVRAISIDVRNRQIRFSRANSCHAYIRGKNI